MTNLEKVLRERNLYPGQPFKPSGLAEIARVIGISRNSISRHINKRGRLNLITLQKIANFLEIEIKEIMDLVLK